MKYFNTILTRGLNLIKSWLRPGFILLSILFTLGVGQMWATKTIYYANPNDWNPPYCYAWGTGNNGWPGKAMTATDHKKDGHTIYKIDLSDSYTKCIFSNNGANQTGDITFTAGKVTSDGSSWSTYNASYWDAEYGEKNIYLDISSNTGWKIADGYVGFHLYWDKAASDGQHKERLDATLVEGNIYVVTYSRFNSPFIRGWKAARWSTGGGDDWNTSNGIATSSTSTNNKLSVPSGGWSGCTLTWGTYVPTVSSVALSYSVVPTSGSGTSVDPYIVATGTSVTVTATPTSVIDDSQCTMKYSWDSGSYGTTTTKTLNCSTNNTTYSTTVTCQNYISSTGGNTASATVYFKAVSTPTIGLTAPSSGVRGNSITLTAAPSNASTPTIYYEYSTSSTFASSVTEINHTTSTTQSWAIPSGTSGTTYYLRAKMQVSSTWYYSSILTFTAYGKKTIHVKNTNGWGTLYLYAWDSSDNKLNGNWPGKSGTGSNGLSCTNTGGQWWDVVITSQISGFILNANVSGDANQTADLSYSTYTNDRCLAIGTGSGKKTLSNTAVTCPSEPTGVTTTAAPTASTNTGMTIKGSIGGNGNDKITSYGFYYGTTTACSTQAQVGTTDKTGDFTKALTGLTAGTTYYFKAYATNGQGTTYGTRYSYTIPYSVTVSKSTGCESITPSAGSYYYNAGFTVTAVAATGYTFSAWSKTNGNLSGASEPSTGTNTVTFTPTANSATITATYTPKTTTITLQNTGQTGYGSGSNRSVTGTYDAAMPTVAAGNLPTATNGYAFMGYWDAANGEGTQYYNADGTSARNWDKVAATETLYAYFKKAEIADITLSPAAVEWKESGDNFVQATPTIAPTPVGTVTVCWELLYDNEDPITGHDPIVVSGSTVKFNLAGLAAGNYRIRAKLHLGTGCGGTLLHTYDKIVTVTNNFTVTVFYKCGDATIKSSTEVEGKPITAKSITAPTITGYTFHHWVLGDGITCTSGTVGDATHTGSSTISYTAIFDGSITAMYTRKRMIYFYNTLGWSTVNVYFYKNNSYWDDSKGTGSDHTYTYTDTPYSEQKHGAMTRISGTNIWYFDCEGAGVPSSYNTVAFTEVAQNGYGFFSYKSGTTANNVVRRDDYNSAMPMFVPVSQTPVSMNSSQAKYYSKGYWMNYPENTGYTLKIYTDPYADNATGAAREILFPYSADLKMPLKLDVEFNDAARHEYWFMIYSNDNIHRGANYNMNQNYHSDVALNSNTNKIHIITSATGIYTYTLYYNNTPSYYVTVDYPVTVGDYRLVYNDLAKWSGASNHASTWWHESRVIPKKANQTDTVSFYIAKGSSPRVKVQKVNSITEGTGAISWTDVSGGWKNLESSVTKSGVYNLIMTQDGSGNLTISKITKVEPYTGNFYIRTDGAGSTKWDAYTFPDHQMTYTEFSFSDANSFGEKYSHYYCRWCPRATNVKFVVATDYSPCISDTLIQDVGNPYDNIYLNDPGGRTDGELKAEAYDGSGNPTKSETADRYSANIRFMYNYSTNKISRAYVASATNYARLFLVLKANAEIQDESREPYAAQGISNAVILMDKENWMYEEILYITPGTRFKLFACYAEATPTQSGAQYFRGAWASDAFTSDANSVILIGGSGEMQKARVIYDFKTNRLIAAWIPAGTDIDNPIGINADVLIEREHQNPAQYVTFKNDGALTGVKVIYGAMKFNRWILNNRSNPNDIDPTHAKTTDQLSTHHPPLAVGQQKSIYERSLYFISFPFDVRVSEIFGFGHYWDEWYLEYYDGLNRAKNGYWIDSPPNWKYVTPEMASSFVLKANEGYILGLDLDYMQADNFSFWSNGISTVELFFPSTTTATGSITEISEVVIPSLPSTYQCTINRTGIDGDRRVKDSYWRCIGVPSFNIYNKAVKDASGNVISWTTDYNWETNPRTFPFIYRWNMSDNTITPQSTSAFAFQPMHSYLVQNGGEIHWTNVSGPSAIVARRARKEDYTEYNWRLALMSDTTLIDQTYVRMSELEQITDSFDFGQDMSKEFNAYRSDLYTRIGYERLAANSMPLNTETTTIVPVGIKVYKAGEFTLSMPDGTYGVSITLVDNLTGARTELGAGFTYSFESEAGQFDERFHLEIAKIQSVATGTEEIGEPSKSDVRKVIINGILYIVRGNRIYDARGTRVE